MLNVVDVMTGATVTVATLHQEPDGTVRVELLELPPIESARARNGILWGRKSLMDGCGFDELPRHFGPHWVLGPVE